MSIDTPLNVSPYFNDFDETKNDQRILFKPVLAVQVRELNQLQDILQKQIERFGDSIYQSGTIIDGCNFSFMDAYPYVKILDTDVAGDTTIPENYLGLFVKNAANLQGYVVNYASGFESAAPDLKTIFVKYINSGNTGNLHAFTPGDILTVTDANVSIFKITANNGGVSFANSDAVVFTSAVAVNVSSGTFAVSDYVSQGSANLQVTAIDSNTLASAGQIILNLKPRDVDLANASVNSAVWTILANNTLTSQNSAVGTVTSIYGSSAAASITTDGAGRVIRVNMINQGSGYSVLPAVRIRSVNNSTGLASLSLIPQNYKTQLKTANTVDGVGNGYSFAVSNGVIYQKGMFLRVDAQSIIVSKYSQAPSNVAVGFESVESIVDVNIDSSLYDNSAGFPNFEAPGADRLRVVPTLVLANTANVATDFLKICVWSEGNPYQQNPTSLYSDLGDEMARRTYEQSGNFALDKFQVITRSPANSALEGNTFSVVVDPGTAYIDGYRVQTSRNFVMDVKKGTDSFFTNNYSMSLNYGNWIRVKELGGNFQYNTGDSINLYDTAKGFLSGMTFTALNAVGNRIGAARIRSLVRENGAPGLANTTYKLYLFDINMISGKNFSDVRNIGYYQGVTPVGTADVVTELSPTTNLPICKLANTEFDTLVFPTGVETLKNAANTTYNYRTLITASVANTGVVSFSVASDPYASFLPHSGLAMSTADLQSLHVMVTGPSGLITANTTGTISVNTTSPNVVGTSTTFVSDYATGDYVYLQSNSTVNNIRLIKSIVNNTLMIVDANVSFTSASGTVSRVFPLNAPVPFGYRTGLTGNVSTNGSVMTLNFGMALGSTSNVTIGVDVKESEVPAGTKQAVRDHFIKISAANNADGVSGPWCLGVPDAFRLKKVYSFSNSSVNTASRDVTSSFYIDSNQNEDYVDLSYLYVRPNSGYAVSSSDWLLVQFDYFSHTSGFYNSVSYLSSNLTTITTTDSLPLANLASSINSFEVPELYTAKGDYYDMLGCFDFRPIAANTTAPATTAASAPVNPTYALSFGNTANSSNELKFPSPDSFLTANLEYFGARIDSTFVAKDGNIFTISGNPSKTKSAAVTSNQPKNTMKLNDLSIPPYPNLPANPSGQLAEILSLNIANERLGKTRINNKTIKNTLAPNVIEQQQPTAYSQAAIGAMDRRLQAVEYHIGLSALETDMVNKVVLSSDGNTTRFKFGLFVDNFSTTISQDISNPAYAAAIVSGLLTPPYFQWDVTYADSVQLNQPYIDFKLIDQDNATYAAPVVVPVTPVVTPVVPVTPPIIIPPPSPTIYNGSLTAYDYAITSEFPNLSGLGASGPTFGRFEGDTSPATKVSYGYTPPTALSFDQPQTPGFYSLYIPRFWIVRGLKPNTLHKFYVNGIEDTPWTYSNDKEVPWFWNGSQIVPSSGTLVTDSSGHLAFRYMPNDIYGAGADSATRSIVSLIPASATPYSGGNTLLNGNPTGTFGSPQGTFSDIANPNVDNVSLGKVLFQFVAPNSSAQVFLDVMVDNGAILPSSFLPNRF